MDWQAIGAFGEIVGAGAVVASLIYLATQLRQTNTLARAATYEAIGSRFSDLWMNMALNPEWAEITRRWSRDPLNAQDVEGLSETEKHRMVAFFVAQHRQFEATWRQVKLGLIDSSTMFKFGNDAPAFKGVISDNQRLLWPQIKRWMSPDYAEFIEGALMEANPGEAQNTRSLFPQRSTVDPL